MKYLLFTLDMPNVGSWNGQWKQVDKLHCVIRAYRKNSHEQRIEERI